MSCIFVNNAHESVFSLIFFFCDFIFIFFYVFIKNPPHLPCFFTYFSSNTFRFLIYLSGFLTSSTSLLSLSSGLNLYTFLSSLAVFSPPSSSYRSGSVSYTHLRAHETPEHLVCRLLLEKKKQKHLSRVLRLVKKKKKKTKTERTSTQ